MHNRSLLGRHGFGAAASSRTELERRPAVVAWLAVIAGVAICAIAALLL
jgi:hypothetical protein